MKQILKELQYHLIAIANQSELSIRGNSATNKTEVHKTLLPSLTCRPSSQAFLATRPAPSMTLGFDVFVQLVIAAITTLPCLSSAGCPWNENFATLSCASFGTAKPYIIIKDWVSLQFQDLTMDTELAKELKNKFSIAHLKLSHISLGNEWYTVLPSSLNHLDTY